MTAVLETIGLSKRYGHRPALSDCTLSLPPGHVVGLVGPNGAGKTTLLHLAVGLLVPTSGTIEVLGGRPGSGPAQLARVGFVAQEAPTYAALSVADHLRLGARLNPGWDARLAQRRIEHLGLDPAQRAGQLSGGQRAQLARSATPRSRSPSASPSGCSSAAPCPPWPSRSPPSPWSSSPCRCGSGRT
jgi:ABC-2 type transport system ATP-binding protein